MAGAFHGAGRGAAGGLFALGGGGCQGAICGAFLLLALATAVVVGGAVGAVAGALATTPEAEAPQIEQAVHRCVEELPAHLDLARHVLEAADRQGGVPLVLPADPPNEVPFLARELSGVAVASLRPTLRWEAFPDDDQRAQFRAASGLEMGDVRYGLRIWSVRGDERRELVYERRGLAAPTHRLEQPLLPHRRYFWSLRACFAVGEGTAYTPWASSLVPSRGRRSCESPDIPASNYFRFRTR